MCFFPVSLSMKLIFFLSMFKVLVVVIFYIVSLFCPGISHVPPVPSVDGVGQTLLWTVLGSLFAGWVMGLLTAAGIRSCFRRVKRRRGRKLRRLSGGEEGEE